MEKSSLSAIFASLANRPEADKAGGDLKYIFESPFLVDHSLFLIARLGLPVKLVVQ